MMVLLLLGEEEEEEDRQVHVHPTSQSPTYTSITTTRNRFLIMQTLQAATYSYGPHSTGLTAHPGRTTLSRPHARIHPKAPVPSNPEASAHVPEACVVAVVVLTCARWRCPRRKPSSWGCRGSWASVASVSVSSPRPSWQ